MGRENARKAGRGKAKAKPPRRDDRPSTTALAAETIRYEENRRAFGDLSDSELLAKFNDACKSATSGLPDGAHTPTRVIARGGQSVVLELAAASPNAEKLAIRLVDPKSPLATWTDKHASNVEAVGGPLTPRGQGAQYVYDQRVEFQVLPLLAGRLLPDAVSKSLTPQARLERFAKLVAIVDRVHNSGRRHFDIKPDNILAAHGGWPVLIDFGNAAPATASTRPNGASPGYAAPEQVGVCGDEPSASTDVFALGMVLWEYLHGEPVCPPDQSKDLASYVAYLRNDHAARLLALGTSDAKVAAIVRDCCAIAPSTRRIKDAAELSRRVRELPGSNADRGSDSAGANASPTPDQLKRFRLTRRETEEADTLGRALGVSGNRLQLAEIHIRIAIRNVVEKKGGVEKHQLTIRETGRDFIEATKHHDFLLIKGVAGSGKTTVLRYLANALARKQLGETLEGDLRTCLPDGDCPEPLFIRLRNVSVPSQYVKKPQLAQHPNAFNTILSAWLEDMELTYPIDALVDDVAAGRCVLLLDGLDEVSDDGERAALAKAIGVFATKIEEHAKRKGQPTRVRIIVSSRPAAIENIEFPSPLFQIADVLPLKDSQVREFANKWMRLALGVRSEEHVLPGSLASARCASIVKALDPLRSPELFELAHNPMLLTLIVLVHHETGSLPAQRVALYDQAVDVLLRNFHADWVVSKSNWSQRRAREVLAEVAWKCFNERAAAQGDGALAQTTAWVAKHIREQYVENDSAKCQTLAADFLEQHKRKGFVLEMPHEPVEKFLHRSIREFLAGWWLANRSRTERLELFRGGATAPSKDQHEALRMMAGVLASRGAAPAARFVLDILGRSDPKHVKPFAQRASDIAAAIRLVGDMRGFDLAPAVFQPIERDAGELIAAIENPNTKQADRISFAEALGVYGDPRLTDAARWIEIEASTFMYGTNEAPSETPIEAYALARWPVTIEEYAQFVDDDGYASEGHWWAGRAGEGVEWQRPANWQSQLRTKASNHPVVGVSWFEAKAYCAWLTATQGESRYRFDLPTDVQWEAAARGTLTWRDAAGATIKNPMPRREYPWEHPCEAQGEPVFERDRANTSEEPVRETSPVGSFPRGNGPFGHWDLAGNVWEWCEEPTAGRAIGSTKSYYRAEVALQRSFYSDRVLRVIRGGSFKFGAGDARCSRRSDDRPHDRYAHLGFRPARVSADLLHHFTSGESKKKR